MSWSLNKHDFLFHSLLIAFQATSVPLALSSTLLHVNLAGLWYSEDFSLLVRINQIKSIFGRAFIMRSAGSYVLSLFVLSSINRNSVARNRGRWHCPKCLSEWQPLEVTSSCLEACLTPFCLPPGTTAVLLCYSKSPTRQRLAWQLAGLRGPTNFMLALNRW